jgi:hypothetical protein
VFFRVILKTALEPMNKSHMMPDVQDRKHKFVCSVAPGRQLKAKTLNFEP